MEQPRHFRANRGRLLKVKPSEGAEYVDRLVEVGDAELKFESGRTQALAAIDTAFVEIEFNRKDVEPIAFDVTGEE